MLLDVFIGREPEESEDAFPADYDLEADIAYIKSYNGRIEDLKKKKRDFFGPNVLKLCREADIVFLALHGENGENGKVQGRLTCLIYAIQEPGVWAVHFPWIKASPKRFYRMAEYRYPAESC